MLEWTWSLLLTLASFVCAIRAAVLGRDPASDFGEMGFAIASIGLMGVSLAVSSDLTVLPVCSWLHNALPERGSEINALTAVVLTGVACAVVVFGAPFTVAMTVFRYQEVSDASNIAKHAIERAREDQK